MRDYKDVQREGKRVSRRVFLAHKSSAAGGYVREERKRAPGEFELKELIPVKGTNQVVEVTTFTRYPNYQTIEKDREDQIIASER